MRLMRRLIRSRIEFLRRHFLANLKRQSTPSRLSSFGPLEIPPPAGSVFAGGPNKNVQKRSRSQTGVFYTLLLALLLPGTVPQGLMRSSDDDGMAILLCTTSGPTEVWLPLDGELQDEAPADHSSSEMADCLAVTLSLGMVKSWFETLAQHAEFSPI